MDGKIAMTVSKRELVRAYNTSDGPAQWERYYGSDNQGKRWTWQRITTQQIGGTKVHDFDLQEVK